MVEAAEKTKEATKPKDGGDKGAVQGGDKAAAEKLQREAEVRRAEERRRAEEAARKAREAEEARKREEEARKAREEAERKLREMLEKAKQAEQAKKAELAKQANEAAKQLEEARKAEKLAAKQREEAEAKEKEAAKKATEAKEAADAKVKVADEALKKAGLPGLELVDKKKPSDMTPEERVAAKQKDYTDEKTGVKYTYDDKGRIGEMAAKDGKVTRLTYGEKDQPTGMEIRANDGKLISQNTGDIKVDQKNGEVVITSDPKDRRGREQKIENHYHPDGGLDVIHMDAKGHRLQKEECVQTAEGTKVVGKFKYEYLDNVGRPSEDPNKIDDSKPVLATRTDEKGRVTDRYQFATSADVQQQNPAGREQITYSEDTQKNKQTEVHQVFDLTSQTPDRSLSTTTRTLDRNSGVTTVDTTQANGVSQHVELDINGKALAATRKEGDNEYKFNLDRDGRVQSVTVDGKPLTGNGGETAKRFGEMMVETTRQQYGIRQSEKAENVAGDNTVTGPRDGTKPSGTLVYKEGQDYKQVTIQDGEAKDASGKKIGTVQDNGAVTLDGQPPKTFNISETEGAAFHGIGSDKNRLDMVAKADEKGFSGQFKSPDGKENLSVVGGNMYDKEGKFVGHLDPTGQVHLKDHVNLAANSFHEGWKFEGTEDGKARAFEASPQMSNGKVFVPDETGKPVEYEVRMGMLINKQTGEQFGTIKPPSESADGKLSGGTITKGNPPQEIPLENFTAAVFNLKLQGQSGIEGREIKGASLGPRELQADGTVKPGGKGGMFNITDAIATQEKAKSVAAQKERDNEGFHPIDWLAGAQDMNRDSYKMDQQTAQRWIDMYSKMANEGRVIPEQLQRLGGNIDQTKAENIGGKDALVVQKEKLDSNEKKLEELPKDTSTINGTVNIASKDAPGGHMKLTIDHGKILGGDGKTPIGSIDNNEGRLVMVNPQTGQPTEMNMRDLQGAVWHLEYPTAQGQKQSVDWVSMGPQNGMVSINELRRKAADEIAYARNIDKQSDNEKSHNAAAESIRKDMDFEKRLDNIVANGVNDGDLEYLAKGPKEHVRAEEFKDKTPPSEKHTIELPKVTSEEEAKTVNGRMRLGSENYQIKNGELYLVHKQNGQDVVDEKPTGKFGPGYTVQLPGREPIALANENRVVMEITVGNSQEKHQIIGLGPARTTQGFGRTEGGLVDAKELYRQVDEALVAAKKGEKDYFDNRPYLTGSLANWAMGDREQILKDFQANITRSKDMMQNSLGKLFEGGFDDEKFNNNKVDGYIKVTQMLLSNAGMDAQTHNELAAEGKQMQKMTSDAVVMAAITVATAGTGAVFSAAATAGRIGLVTAYAGEVAVGTTLGAGISVAGRASDNSNWVDNAKAGAFEGFAMSAGSVGMKGMGELSKAQTLALAKAEQGLALTKAEQMLVATSGKGSQLLIKGGYKVFDSTLQTTAFTASGAIREHDWHAFNAQNLALGSMWMLAGQGLGHFSGGGMQRLGLAEQSIAKRMVSDTVMAYTNSSLGAMTQGWEMERMRIAQELHLSPDLVTNDMMKSRVNYSNIWKTMNEAGATGALTAPFLTLATHPLQMGAEKMLGVERAPDGHVITPAERQGLQETGPKIDPKDAANNLPIVVLAGETGTGGGGKKSGGVEPHAGTTNGGERTNNGEGGMKRSSAEVPVEPQPQPQPKVEPIVKDSKGRVEQVRDDSGNPVKKFEYNRKGEVTQVEHADGTVWKSKDGEHWQILPKGAAEDSTVQLFKGKIQVGEDGSMRITDAKGVRIERPDGSSRVEPAYLQANYEKDASGKVTKLTNANNVEYAVARNERGEVEKITGNNGEVIERDGTGYRIVKEGKVQERVTNVEVAEDGTVRYKNESGDFISRAVDGSVSRTEPSGRTTLVEVNPQVEKVRLARMAHEMVPNLTEKARLITAMRDMEARSQRLGMDPQEVGKTFHELTSLLKSDGAMLPQDQRTVIAEQILRNAARPYDVNQGNHNTCNVTTATVRMFSKYPSEAARVIREAVETGQVMTADGHRINIRREDVMPDHEASLERGDRLGKKDDTYRRSHADQILQNIAVNAYWQRKTIGPDGNSYALGNIRYEQHPSTGRNDTGERLIDLATGQRIKENTRTDAKESQGPELYAADLEEIYGQLTGHNENFVISHQELNNTKGNHRLMDQQRLFTTQDEFLQTMQRMNPSEANPIVVEVTTLGEPFYKDSNAGTAGGSGGQHVVSITGFETRPNGEVYVRVDNQWGKAAQHGAGHGDSGEPIKLSDLYYATFPADHYQRIQHLQAELQGNPVKLLDYYRAMRERYNNVEKGIENKNLDPVQAQKEREYFATHTQMSREEYVQQLDWLIRKIDKEPHRFTKATPEDLKYAREVAVATKAVVQKEIAEKAAAAGKDTTQPTSDKPRSNVNENLARRENESEEEFQRRANLEIFNENTERAPVTKLPPEFSTERIPVLAREISDATTPKFLEKEGFQEIFAGTKKNPFSDRQRQIAIELMEQSAANIDSKSLNAQMASLEAQIRKVGVETYPKYDKDGNFSKNVDRIQVFVTDQTSSGNALAHLLSKNTGLEVQVTVLDKNGRIDLQRQIEKGKIHPESFVLLDDIRSVNAEQRDFMKQIAGNKLVVTNMQGFDKGFNFADMSVASLSGNHAMKTKMGLLVKEVEIMMDKSGLSKEEAVRKVLEGDFKANVQKFGKAKVITPDRTTVDIEMQNRRAARDATSENPEYKVDSLYREFTRPLASKEQIEAFLGQVSASVEYRNARGISQEQANLEAQIMAGHMLRDAAEYVDYPTMVQHAKELHDRIIWRVKQEKGLMASDRDVIYITGAEKDGSSYLANHLYAKTNGLTNSNFMTAGELSYLGYLAKNGKLSPAEAAKLEGKTFVYLDDYSLSGRQNAKIAAKMYTDSLQYIRGRDGKPVMNKMMLASFGRYETGHEPLDLIRAEFPNLGDFQVENVTGSEPRMSFYEPQNLERLGLGDYPMLAYEVGRAPFWESAARTTMVLPYGGPNNNIFFIQKAIEMQGMYGLPRRFPDYDWNIQKPVPTN